MRRFCLPTARPVPADRLCLFPATAAFTDAAAPRRRLALPALACAAALLALAAGPAAAHTRYSFSGKLVASPQASAAAALALATPQPGDAISGWFDLPTGGDYGYSNRPDGTGTAKALYWEIDYPSTPETLLVDWALTLPTAEARKKDVYGNPSSSLRRTLHADGSSSLVIESSFMRGGGGVRSQDFKLTYVASDASLFGDLSTPLDLSKVTRAWGSYSYHDESFGQVLSSVRYDFELQTGAVPVPEPAAWWLWLGGLPLAWGARRMARTAGR